MIYNNAWLETKLATGAQLIYLFFWKPPSGYEYKLMETCLGQWYERAFTENSNTYKTAEHYMMAGKAKLFGDQESRQKIIDCTSPNKARSLGRKVTGFDEKIWKQHRCDIVQRGNYLKFSQHPDLLDYLLGTENQVLVEASPYDAIWGIGMDEYHPDVLDPSKWKGSNLLGYVIMTVRDQLRYEQ